MYRYVCMYVCMYACMHECMFVCWYVCMYVYMKDSGAWYCTRRAQAMSLGRARVAGTRIRSRGSGAACAPLGEQAPPPAATIWHGTRPRRQIRNLRSPLIAILSLVSCAWTGFHSIPGPVSPPSLSLMTALQPVWKLVKASSSSSSSSGSAACERVVPTDRHSFVVCQ